MIYCFLNNGFLPTCDSCMRLFTHVLEQTICLLFGEFLMCKKTQQCRWILIWGNSKRRWDNQWLGSLFMSFWTQWFTIQGNCTSIGMFSPVNFNFICPDMILLFKIVCLIGSITKLSSVQLVQVQTNHKSISFSNGNNCLNWCDCNWWENHCWLIWQMSAFQVVSSKFNLSSKLHFLSYPLRWYKKNEVLLLL